MKKILGISAYYHDSSAAIIIGGNIIAAAQEERFTREKNTAEFPYYAIKYCLEESGLELDELDAVVYYEKPLLKFERLLQTYLSFAPIGLVSFVTAIPVWLKEKLFFKKLVYKELKKVGDFDKNNFELLFSGHHLSHSASCFFTSPYDRAAILTIDGVGEWCTASIGVGNGGSLEVLKDMEFPHSVGLLYSAFTYYLGFKVNSGEYKLMGLAPYGKQNSENTLKYIRLIKSVLIDIKVDGSIWLNQDYFNYSVGLIMVREKKWLELFGFQRRNPESRIEQNHCDLAYAIQQVTEEIVIKMAHEAKRLTGADYLCMAGGVALNCVANGKLMSENIFKGIFIQPAAGDSGGSLGAALAASFMYFKEERILSSAADSMKGAYLGPHYSDKEIELMNKKTKSVFIKYDNFQELTEFVSIKLAEGNIVGWFQGKMEFGPRALGNRSILADPRSSEMQKRLNIKIKRREEFRPFAPSVLVEDVSAYFEINTPSPYMQFAVPIKNEKRNTLPENYHGFSLWDKLYFNRSELPCITHIDFSARIQTVHKETNLRFWELISAFKKQTGCSVIVNTSFNIRGEPIVCSPFDAYRCFMGTDMDYLVIENYIYTKTSQYGYANTLMD